MKSLRLFLTILFCSATVCLTGCSKKDRTISVADDDPEMLAAIAKAGASLPQFWDVFDKHEHGESDFCLKVKITDGKQVEFFWLTGIERKDGKVFGTVDNDPDLVKTVKLGDRIPIPQGDISDWFYLRDGKMVGNYTIRVLFKEMSPQDIAKYKKILADP